MQCAETKPILIVGTTSDYIHWIRQACPGRALFVTAPDIRLNAREKRPLPKEEILVALSDPSQVLDAVKAHLKHWGLVPGGIFCFDCEAMALTAFLAQNLGLDYPSARAIENCRDKYLSKQIWQEYGIPCPRTMPVKNLSDATAFLHSMPRGCVLKPFAGSGSELVFECMDAKGCKKAYQTIAAQLETRRSLPLFRHACSEQYLMLAEERVPGIEFSCDFIVDQNGIRLIRLARKITSPYKPFGTILGYMLPARLPLSMASTNFEALLLQGARALGIHHGICMADVFVNQGQARLIEMTPRPGGDCLPHLLKAVCGMDILKICLDFAQGLGPDLSPYSRAVPHAGIRLISSKAGVVKRIDTSRLDMDPRITGLEIIRRPGHRIQLPPGDYDSMLLGHMIFKPDNETHMATQALTVSKLLTIDIEPGNPTIKGRS